MGQDNAVVILVGLGGRSPGLAHLELDDVALLEEVSLVCQAGDAVGERLRVAAVACTGRNFDLFYI